jgi:hypothetical protein
MPTDVTPTPFRRFEVDVETLATVTLGGPPTALVIDLDPVAGVCIAAALNQQALARPVLIVPRWPHLDAVLPSSEFIGALVRESRRVQCHVETAHVAFVLDGERSRSIRRPAADPRIDNRYDLAVGDLPTLRQLRRAGIERIVKLSPTARMSRKPA